MTTAFRSILIDDANSAIHYSAGWIAANTTQLHEQGNYGPVYGGTTHATTTTGSDLTFEFSGTSIAVFGTINFTDTNGATWKCLIDGNAIPEQNPTFQFPENNWNLCAQSQLSAGKHNLTINVHGYNDIRARQPGVHYHFPKHTIVCASIGGLILFALLAGVTVWYRKRRKRVSAARTPVPFLVSEGEPAARYMILLAKSMGPGVDPGAGTDSAPRGGHSIPVVQQQTLDIGLRNPRGFASARKLLRQPGPEVVVLPPGYQS